MLSRDSYYLKRAIPALVIVGFVFLLPMVLLYSEAILNGETLKSTFLDINTWKILLFTIIESSLSAFFSILISLPFAVFFSRYSFPCRKAILTFSDTAFALPSIIAVLAFVIFYGNNGALNSLLSLITGSKVSVKFLYSFPSIIFAHVYLNFPVAFSILTGAFLTLPENERKASLLLGKSKAMTFMKITLPSIKGSLISTFALIFLFCFPSFLIVLTLGGSPKFYTLEAEIYRRTYMDASIARSASLSLFSLLFMTIVLLLSGYGRNNKKRGRENKELIKAKGKKKVLGVVLSLIIALFMFPPLLSILYRAFFNKDGTFTLKAWKTLYFTGDKVALRASLNSITIALLSSFVAVKIASTIALYTKNKKSPVLSVLLSLPMAVGSVSLGLGFSILSSFIPFSSPLISYALVFLAHIAIITPFAIRTITPEAKKMPSNLYYASKVLGASNHKTRKLVEEPYLRNSIKRAFAFSFALSLGEVNATLSLGQSSFSTIPVLMYKLINQYNYQGAATLSIILLLCAALVFYFGEKE